MTAARNTRPSRANAASNAADVAKGAVAKAQAKPKAKIAIFTRNSDKVQAALFITVSDKELAPMFGGSIQGTRVSAFLRYPANHAKQPFLSFVDSDNVQIATANARVRKEDGIPVLMVMLGKEGEPKTEAWFRFSKNVSDAMLEKMGADMTRLHKKAPKETAAA